MKRAEREAAEKLVGRAFRCPDGLVRWITGLSTRGYYSLLWLDERSSTWFSGGLVRAHSWQGGVEVEAPKQGERYRLAGPMGTVDERAAGACR